MCRSIKTLHLTNQPSDEAEILAAALQYVRKISGYRKPSKVNQAVFEQAVLEVAQATRSLLSNLTPRNNPHLVGKNPPTP